MNLSLSELCEKYDLDHWVWVPVDFLVQTNPQKAAKFLSEQEAFYKECPRIDAVFVPGGDPGDNPFKDLLPYVEQMAAVLRKYHPQATDLDFAAAARSRGTMTPSSASSRRKGPIGSAEP